MNTDVGSRALDVHGELDLVSLGEVMLRLDPGEDRIRNARNFRVWEGGGEYNVARGLSTCFGLRTGVVTALADNEIGRLVEGLVRQGGVSTDLIDWTAHDGVGRHGRVGLNFTERGFGDRRALGVSDRSRSAASLMKKGSVDWDSLFSGGRIRWLHTGGVFASLTEDTAALAEEGLRSARAHGVGTSYDANFRPSLWQGDTGRADARALNQRLLRYVDVAIGDASDYVDIAYQPDRTDDTENWIALQQTRFGALVDYLSNEMPTVGVAASTFRSVTSASVNTWAAAAWSKDEGIKVSSVRPDLQILDRVGGGDSFVAGLIYGLTHGEGLQKAVEIGAAHGALAMTTAGDSSNASKAEVMSLADGASLHSLR